MASPWWVLDGTPRSDGANASARRENVDGEIDRPKSGMLLRRVGGEDMNDRRENPGVAVHAIVTAKDEKRAGHARPLCYGTHIAVCQFHPSQFSLIQKSIFNPS
jgi:hypothetical protein